MELLFLKGTKYTSAHHQPIGSQYVGRHLDWNVREPAPCNDTNIPVLSGEVISF